jgi:transposase
MARPSKLSPELQERCAALIRAGNTVEVAAEAAGISEATFYAWMARGEQSRASDRPYREFRAAVEQARAEAEATLVTRIAKAAANGSWPAAAWLLERRYSERWAKVTERNRASRDEDEAKVDPLDALDGEEGAVVPLRRRAS